MYETWKSRYTGIVRALVHHSNAVSRTSGVKFDHGEGIMLNHQQWQFFEQIIEHENDYLTMTEYADIIGVSKSLVTQTSKLLISEGLISRFRTSDNMKNIILKPTEKGRLFYKNWISSRANNMFDDFFNALSPLSDEQLEIVEKAILILDKNIAKDSEIVLSPIE